MAGKRWIRAGLLTACVAALPVRAAPAQLTGQPAGPSAPISIPSLVQGDINHLKNELIGRAPATRPGEEGSIQQRRDEAACRLMSRASPEAHAVLLNVLQDPAASHEAKLAVARAIADDPNPDARFVASLMGLLGNDRALCDAAARALSRFGSDARARARLISFARDADNPAAMRSAVIRAMGNVVSRDVADALLTILGDTNQLTAIQTAAGDALLQMTGLTNNGHDPARWRAWQQANSSKPEVEWRADVLTTRDEYLSRLGRDQAAFNVELRATVNEFYDKADQKTKSDLVLRFLSSAEPHMRQMGVGLVVDAHNNATAYPPEAPARLRELVGDSDADVRLAVARAIKALNDTGALDGVLAQLAQEPSAAVRAALIDALKPMGKVQAAPELQGLLHDPSMTVATQAAQALRTLAPAIAKDSTLALNVANELWQVGNERAGEQGGENFRAATIEAVGPLHDVELAVPLTQLLNPNESDPIRSAALRALGEIGEPRAGAAIAQWLNRETSPKVLIDGLDALSATRSFEDAAPTLYKYMSPQVEPDKAVRERAWLDYESKLPSARNVEVLTQEADRFQNDPAKKLIVLRALDDRLAKDAIDDTLSPAVRNDRLQSLASFQQTTGQLEMELGNPTSAANYFRDALNYWQERRTANQTTVTLVRQLLQAFFASRQYNQATQFAAKQIAADRAQQTEMGPAILHDGVEPLMNQGVQTRNPQKLRDAQSLIDSALAMDPPLDMKYQDDLRSYRQDIDKALASMPKPQ
ncbi:MAG TPA: HEAT repeat domain-containing protein [Tepidisphaeraceae bacterium]|nr:HEAT repeat domain-containing protein [Tepidisphaeraceae bacterium]